MFWNRIAKRPSEATDEEADAERAAHASQRLGGLVLRQREEEEAVNAAQAPEASMLASAFANCAFFVLGVPIDAPAADVRRAYDGLSFAEDADTEALAKAQATLLSPRDRLKHELAWLPSCDAAFQQRACAAVRKGDCDTIDSLRFGASGLARLNTSALRC